MSMKTSKYIITISAGIIILIMISTLFVLKRDMKSLTKTDLVVNYKTIQVNDFNIIHFSPYWDVIIKQGKDYKIELALNNSTGMETNMENVNGILYLKAVKKQDNQSADDLQIRITAPVLQEIIATGNTNIQLRNFWSDSLTVVLKDSSVFSGSNNDFTKITFKASGSYQSN